MIEVEIHEVHATREDGMLTLALAGVADGGDAYLILSLDETPHDQDVEIGLARVHAEWNDQAHSGYGVIRSARWSGADLAIIITEDGQQRGIPETILLRAVANHLAGNDRILADVILASL